MPFDAVSAVDIMCNGMHLEILRDYCEIRIRYNLLHVNTVKLVVFGSRCVLKCD